MEFPCRKGETLADRIDDDLLRRYAGGDTAAFEQLFDRHAASVYNFARYLLGSASLAEDALQETFLAVARSADRSEPRGLFRPWLLRIARNCCRTLISRQPPVAPPPARQIDPRQPSALRLCEQMDELEAVRRGLDALPPAQREAIVLYAFEELTYPQIAQVMAIPEGSVKTLIHRGRATLQRRLHRTSGDGS